MGGPHAENATADGRCGRAFCRLRRAAGTPQKSKSALSAGTSLFGERIRCADKVDRMDNMDMIERGVFTQRREGAETETGSGVMAEG